MQEKLTGIFWILATLGRYRRYVHWAMYFALAVLICVVAAHISYYMLYLNNDTVFETQTLASQPALITASYPQVVYADKEYKLFINASDVVSETSVQLIVHRGVTLLPTDILTMTVAPSATQSIEIGFIGAGSMPTATLRLSANNIAVEEVVITKEGSCSRFIRMVFIVAAQPILPALLLFLSVFVLTTVLIKAVERHETTRLQSLEQRISVTDSATLGELEDYEGQLMSLRARELPLVFDTWLRTYTRLLGTVRLEQVRYHVLNQDPNSARRVRERLESEDIKTHADEIWKKIEILVHPTPDSHVAALLGDDNSPILYPNEHIRWLIAQKSDLLNDLVWNKIDESEKLKEPITAETKKLVEEHLRRMLTRKHPIPWRSRFEDEEQRNVDMAQESVESYITSSDQRPITVITGSSAEMRLKVLKYYFSDMNCILQEYKDRAIYILVRCDTIADANEERIIAATLQACCKRIFEALSDVRTFANMLDEQEWQNIRVMYQTYHLPADPNVGQAAIQPFAARLSATLQVIECKAVYCVYAELPASIDLVALHMRLSGLLERDVMIWAAMAHASSLDVDGAGGKILILEPEPPISSPSPHATQRMP